MTLYANDQWEETLNAYLEGRTLRADAEDLLMRLHLSPGDRDQIERSLRLTDELTLTLRQIQLPAGADVRLRNALRACPAPADLPPHGWRTIESGELARPAASQAILAEDDLLDAALEGRVTMKDLQSLRTAGQLTEPAAEAAEELQSAAEAITDLSPTRRPVPAAMKNRLRSKLEAHMTSEAGDIDPKIADRLLANTPHPKPLLAMPDVMAASDEDPDPQA
jgi:hypothetical protein